MAKTFRKTTETIYRWLWQGAIFPNAFQVRDGWYVPESDVKNAMKHRREEVVEHGLAKPVQNARSSRKGFVGGWK